MDKFLLHIPFGAYEKLYTYNPHTNVRNKSLLHTLLIQGLSLLPHACTPPPKMHVYQLNIYDILYVYMHLHTFFDLCSYMMGGGVKVGEKFLDITLFF